MLDAAPGRVLLVTFKGSKLCVGDLTQYNCLVCVMVEATY